VLDVVTLTRIYFFEARVIVSILKKEGTGIARPFLITFEKE
jgi:hypothetical protein